MGRSPLVRTGSDRHPSLEQMKEGASHLDFHRVSYWNRVTRLFTVEGFSLSVHSVRKMWELVPLGGQGGKGGKQRIACIHAYLKLCSLKSEICKNEGI